MLLKVNSKPAFNLVTANIPKLKNFILRWIQNVDHSVWDHEMLSPDGPSKNNNFY
jgi:hypothetical protein